MTVTRSARIALLMLVIAGGNALRAQPASEQELGTLGELSDSFEALAERVSPAVVHITASGLRVSEEARARGQRAVEQQQSSGSGVIIDPDGYIVTNAHVVDGATRIRVLLAEPTEGLIRGESILKPRGDVLEATVVGIDRETDLAVLKIDRTGVPYLELGDSDGLRPGELVFAFGSPLGLENSVSIGVVSSVARQLTPEDPMIYIQTDAAVNPGNSGGPLVDTAGRVVGVNTLIFSQSGGSEGISFAAPSNIVRAVFDQIVAAGRVRRGLIGIRAQTISATLARGLGLDRTWGVILSDVYPGGPADRVGLRVGDVVLSLDDKLMENARQLEVNIYNRRAGEAVVLEVLRGDEVLEVPVAVLERPGDANPFEELVTADQNLVPQLGVLAIELNVSIVALLPPIRRASGVLVAAEALGAAPRGLLPGDVIYAINNEAVHSLGALRLALERRSAGDAVALQVEREGDLLYVTFEADW